MKKGHAYVSKWHADVRLGQINVSGGRKMLEKSSVGTACTVLEGSEEACGKRAAGDRHQT